MGSRILLVAACSLFVVSVQAQGTRWEEHNTLIRDKGTIGQLDGAPFGESISYYAGGLSFTQTDSSIPGNNALPVAVTRTYSVTGHRHPQANLPFGDWDIQLPNIGGIYSTSTGWVRVTTGSYTTARCSVPAVDSFVFAQPPVVGASIGPFEPKDYWNGIQVDLGTGPQDLLLNDLTPPAQPTGGPWRWLTSDRTFVKCLSQVQNAAGEGFFAIDERGTKYWFDWMAATLETSLRSPACDPWGSCGSYADRKHYRLYATRVEDRFGNYVVYAYTNDPDSPVKLESITSSDGRVITLSYNAHDNVASVHENGRLWTYAYDYTAAPTLVAVTRPDSSSWQFDFAELSSLVLASEPAPPNELQTCNIVRNVLDHDVVKVGTVTHPSGLVGEFSVKPTLFGRTEVPFACTGYGDPYWDPNRGDPIFPMRWWAPAVVSKKTYGPAVPHEEWTYEYGGDWGFNQTPGGQPNPAQPGESWVIVHGPAGEWTRYTFGNRYLKNEGLLLKIQTRSGTSEILRTETNEYLDGDQATSEFDFYAGLGISPFYASYSAASRRPLKSRTIDQQATLFKFRVEEFDWWARPVRTTKQRDTGVARREVVTYYDNISLWVLGQEESIVNADTQEVEVSRTFDPVTALPITEHRFGWLRDTLSWNPDGTLLSVAPGGISGRATTLSGWKRGIPQTITYPDGTTSTAVVNNRGEITSVTNELGFTHNYTYEPMGRLLRIDYPAGDTVDWDATEFTLEKAQSGAHNLPAGHWRLHEQTGNRVKTTYLDARWRPVLTHEYDAVDQAGTSTYIVREFDHENRETFVGYPGANPSYAGINREYDALGRPLRVTQNSEVGVLETTFEYADNFETIVTNPRGYQTTTKFQAFDTPTEEFPVEIQGPGSVLTVIPRDVYGKPLFIQRGGVTRTFGYDAQQRLCLIHDPESGAEVVEYDAVGNVAWRARGIQHSSGCPRGAVSGAERIDYQYDLRDRVTYADHPGSSSDISYQYAGDGRLLEVGVGTTIWGYAYNKRRLPVLETLNHDAGIYIFASAYDTMGNLYAESYPGDIIVEYRPDARGRPTQVGPFASDATYHPSGALASVTLGNGVQRTMVENTRRMPARVTDLKGGITVHDWAYAYDQNANLLNVTDYDQAGTQNRTMTYDAYDRLDTVSAPNMWGLADYDYDAADNIRAVSIQNGAHARAYVYQYDSATNRLSSISDNGVTAHTFNYDARGNQIARDGQQRIFDAANRLTSIAGVAAYRYDGHGRRSAVDRPDGTSQINVYTSDGRLRSQYEPAQDKVSHYMYLGSTLVASYEGYTSPPEAPELSGPAASDNGDYMLTWGETPRAFSYKLQQHTGGSWQEIWNGESNSFSESDKANGTYQYRLIACNNAGCSSVSNTVSVQVMLPPDSAPTLTVPISNNTGAFTVSWTPVMTANRYVLEQRLNSGAWVVIHDSSARTKSVTVSEPGSYAYRVAACHYDSCGPHGHAALTVSRPPIPTLTVPAIDYSGSFGVSWTSSPGATYYILYRRLGAGSYVNIYQGSATSTTSTVSTVGSYGFVVYACNPNLACGDHSAVATTQVALPPVPTLTVPSGTQTSGFTVSWSPSYGATTYQLQRNKNGGSWSTILNSGGNSLGQSGLTSGSYGYRVLACGNLGCSAYSTPRLVEVVSPPSSAPSLSASPTFVYFPASFTVSWSSVSSATTYQLEQKKNSGSWSVVQNSSSLSRTVQVNAGQYSYRVRACNAAGCGPYSSTVIAHVESSSNCPPIGPCNDPYSLPTDPPEEW